MISIYKKLLTGLLALGIVFGGFLLSDNSYHHAVKDNISPDAPKKPGYLAYDRDFIPDSPRKPGYFV